MAETGARSHIRQHKHHPQEFKKKKRGNDNRVQKKNKLIRGSNQTKTSVPVVWGRRKSNAERRQHKT